MCHLPGVKHEPHKRPLTLSAVEVSDAELTRIGDLKDKTVAFECDGTWTDTTVRVLGKFGDGGFLPVGYVSGTGAKTLTAPGMILVPEAVDAIKVEATAYHGTTGTITARLGGFKSRTE
jgi:hypothetical protein